MFSVRQTPRRGEFGLASERFARCGRKTSGFGNLLDLVVDQKGLAGLLGLGFVEKVGRPVALLKEDSVFGVDRDLASLVFVANPDLVLARLERLSGRATRGDAVGGEFRALANAQEDHRIGHVHEAGCAFGKGGAVVFEEQEFGIVPVHGGRVPIEHSQSEGKARGFVAQPRCSSIGRPEKEVGGLGGQGEERSDALEAQLQGKDVFPGLNAQIGGEKRARRRFLEQAGFRFGVDSGRLQSGDLTQGKQAEKLRGIVLREERGDEEGKEENGFHLRRTLEG